MTKVYDILIVGGGFAGMSSAILLAQAGHKVDLVDLDKNWRVYGAGITITGPTLRAYKHLGMVNEIAKKGALTTQSKMFLFNGTFLKDFPEPEIDGEILGTGGIMRPILHKMMSNTVKSMNVNVELGVSVKALNSDPTGVDVQFTTGHHNRYDLVIGADGINSKVRELAFPDSKAPTPTGQGCWRVSMNKPPNMDQGEFYMGHKYPAGITLCGPDEMYMYLLTPDDGTLWVTDEEAPDLLKERIQDFGGNIAWIRENMKPDHWVNYRPLSALIQPKDKWVKNRIVLVGDSAHATTPHLASGAGMAVEGGVVLSQELSKEQTTIDEALANYVGRRYERCRDVVETSVEIGRLQVQGAGPDVLGPMMGGALHRLAASF